MATASVTHVRAWRVPAQRYHVSRRLSAYRHRRGACDQRLAHFAASAGLGLESTNPSPSPESSKRGPLTVLGIESSYDDSCCAIVRSDRTVLANVVEKQHHLHSAAGSAEPRAAQEAHRQNLPKAISAALAQSGLALADVDAIAYTRGPGMHECLLIGVSTAQALAAASGKPLIGIHHMEAHELTPLLTEQRAPAFPFLVLLVSGGHTQLVLAHSASHFRILVDLHPNEPSIGRAFDRVSQFLDLPLDAERGRGAVVEAYASQVSDEVTAELPLLHVPFRLQPKFRPSYPHAHLDWPPGRWLQFSFKSAMDVTLGEACRLAAVANGERDPQFSNAQVHTRQGFTGPIPGLQEYDKCRLARRFQSVASKHVVMQVQRALELPYSVAYAGTGIVSPGEEHVVALERTLGEVVTDLVVSGGVASNGYLRSRLNNVPRQSDSAARLKPHYPPIDMCTDNAAMVAWAGIMRLQSGARDEPFDLPIRPKWSLEELYDDVD